MASLNKRGGICSVQWYVNGRENRASLNTDSFQLAMERLRQIESRHAQASAIRFPLARP